ncbi:MAG: hypothetical protein JXO48_08815 [Deltaproteobacteria bacterium]|nr:hypothetical protein [Deltaproteobacteria bacterium]
MDARRRDEGKLTCVRGIIVPWSWDRAGAVVEVVIDTEEEQRYVPVPVEKNRELAAHVRCFVEIEGIIEHRHNERPCLDVREYRITRKPGELSDDGTGNKGAESS